MEYKPEQLLAIASNFELQGEIKEITPFGGGWINDTFRISTVSDSTPDYVLQRINHAIFKQVEMLQDNVNKVTAHIRSKLEMAGVKEIDRRVLTFLSTKEGQPYAVVDSNYWRISILIKDSITYNAVTPEYAYYAGQAFGTFQAQLSDLPATQLGETIPNFHNMEVRLVTFREAVARNAAGRLEGVKELVDELDKRSYDMCKAERLFREGKLTKRINHCDTKVNNMLFDAEGKVLCVIDLDTCMPGFVSSDFGDFMRTGGNNGEEDDQDLTRITFNMDIFKSYTKGYLETASLFLTPIEVELLPFGAKLLTYMQTVRFLTDYLDGDTYYKIKYPLHNKQRSLAQFTLLKSIESHETEMNAFIQECLKK